MAQVVYVDVLLAINFVVNYFLLWGLSTWPGSRWCGSASLGGSAGGKGFSPGDIPPQESVLGMGLFRFVAAAAMVFVAFSPWGWRNSARSC